jgi:hypothetical protein
MFMALSVAVLGVAAEKTGAAAIDLGNAGQYTVLGLSDTDVHLSNTSITGDVGVGPDGKLKFMAPSTINGNIYLDASATTSASAGTLNGARFTGQNLAPALHDALSLSASAAALCPTMTLGKVNLPTTLDGNGGVNVLSISSLSLGNNENLTLNGGANDLFYLNITDGLSLTGNAKILESGGLTPAQVLINVIGAGSALVTGAGNEVDGIILAPLRSANLDGSFNGKVIVGGASLGLRSGATVEGTITNVPEPACAALGVLGLVALFARRLQ